MITKAIILDRVVNTNKYLVRVPFLDASIKESGERFATVSTNPAIHEEYIKDDIVYVSFEDHKANKIIILGKLDSDDSMSRQPRGYANFESLSVSTKVNLPLNTKFGETSVQALINKVNNLSMSSDDSGTSTLEIKSNKFYATYTYEGETYTNVLVIEFVNSDEPAIIPLDDLIESNMLKVIDVSPIDTIEELYENNGGQPFVARFQVESEIDRYAYYILGIDMLSNELNESIYSFEAQSLTTSYIYIHEQIDLPASTTFSDMISNTYLTEYASIENVENEISELKEKYVHVNYEQDNTNSYDYYLAIGTNSVTFRAPLYILPVFMKFSNNLCLTLQGSKYFVTGGNASVTTSMVDNRVNIVIELDSTSSVSLSNFNYQVINNPTNFSLIDLPDNLGFVTANYDSSSVNVVFENNVDKNIVNSVSTTSVIFTIPSTVTHGWISGCTLSLSAVPTFTLNNQSSYDVYCILNGQQVTLDQWDYYLVQNITLEVMIECNGTNIRIYAKQTEVIYE